jgi:hypothetical protein
VIKEKLIGTGDYYMSPEEAVELRLADKITGV